jgi:hypothetical protein
MLFTGYDTNMEIYIIRASNPLDMEGSPDVAAVFIDYALANETSTKLNAQQELHYRKLYKDRWRSFAIEYTVETHPIQNDVDKALAYHRGE